MMLESDEAAYNRDNLQDDLTALTTSSLTATARKAHNLFVAQQKKDVRSLSNQLKRQLRVSTASDSRPREQRVSDSGNSSAGSIMSSSSMEAQSSHKKSYREETGGNHDQDDDVGSSIMLEEVASGTSTSTVTNANNVLKEEANSNSTSLDLDGVAGLDEEPSYQEMLHGNVRRMSNTVGP